MSRGNQREVDRARAQAKLAAKKKSEKKDGTPEQRNMADKEKLAQKVAMKKAREEEEKKKAEEAAKKGPAVVRKKKEKKEEGLDDLLNAGLAKTKSKKK